MAAGTKYVLDTSALFCLKDNEDGADEVIKILERAGKAQPVYLSFASSMEYFYVVYHELGREEAYRAFLELKMLPLEVVESNESLRLAAGEIKTHFSLSFADAWIAATAEHFNAELVHKDPEFEVLSNRLSLKTLPYRKR